MSQNTPERYSDLNETDLPSKETDQRRIAALLMQRGIPLKDFEFKRADDIPDKMITGIQKYAAKLLGLQGLFEEEKERDGEIDLECINSIDDNCDGPVDEDDVVWEADQEKAEEREKPALIPLPFTELSELLAPKGIDLQQQLENHVSFMLRHGAIQKQDAGSYKKKFETIHVQKEELENIPEGWRPMLFIDDKTPVQSAQTFITGTGVNLYEYSNLSGFNKVDPKTKEPLQNQIPSGLARLTFTPDTAKLTPDLTGKSADSHLEQMQKGKRYLEPQQWFQLFAEGLQKAIKELNLGNGKAWKDMTPEEKQRILNNKRIDSYLPDSNTWTQCPDWRNNTSHVFDLDWAPDSEFRGVCVGGAHPQYAAGDLGPRPVLG